jgi:glutathione S-transferase
MTNYTVIGNAASRAARVLWMLEELGLAYEHIGVKPRTDEVMRFNPSGKVPVLLVDGQPITDSTAILAYLADSTGRMTNPAGTLARARQDSLTQAILDEFDAILWTAARHSFILPAEQRVPEVKASLRWEFERNQKIMAQRLGNDPFLMGDEMTVPDIILAHCGHWARSAKFELTEPALVAYVDRVLGRPAFARVCAM